jgi:hypothetical protein
MVKLLGFFDEKFVFLVLFGVGIAIILSLMKLVFKDKTLDVEDTGLMSGYAYKDANDSKYKRWIGAAMLSALHAFLFMFLSLE